MPKITQTRPAGENHQVVTVVSDKDEAGRKLYRKKPCSDCPWRKDATGIFPAEAFRHSAHTAYDMNNRTFACHQQGTSKPALCAGFLLKGADHNLAVRLGYMEGTINYDVSDEGLDLFDNYREMAIANGVDPDDPVLEQCRD